MDVKTIANEILISSPSKPFRIIAVQSFENILAIAILSRALRRLGRRFSIKTLKKSAPMLETQKELTLVVGHEELLPRTSSNALFISPGLAEENSAALVAYLVAKNLSQENADLAKLAVIGMIGGDAQQKQLSKAGQQAISETKDIEIRKGLLIFPITRPLKKSLEYSTSVYIPGVTGNSSGVSEFLREVNISPEKSLYELDDEQMTRLVTAAMLRRAAQKEYGNIVGNLYLVKFFNRKEDIRELSVIINSCLRSGNCDTAIAFCLESERSENAARDIYTKYKQSIIDSFRALDSAEKIEGNGFVILNVKEIVAHEHLDTVTALLSSTVRYREGTVIVGMANNAEKIKVAARVVGHGRSPREVLEKAAKDLQAQVSAHDESAECYICKEKEQDFLSSLQRYLELELVKI